MKEVSLKERKLICIDDGRAYKTGISSFKRRRIIKTLKDKYDVSMEGNKSLLRVVDITDKSDYIVMTLSQASYESYLLTNVLHNVDLSCLPDKYSKRLEELYTEDKNGNELNNGLANVLGVSVLVTDNKGNYIVRHRRGVGFNGIDRLEVTSSFLCNKYNDLHIDDVIVTSIHERMTRELGVGPWVYELRLECICTDEDLKNPVLMCNIKLRHQECSDVVNALSTKCDYTILNRSEILKLLKDVNCSNVVRKHIMRLTT